MADTKGTPMSEAMYYVLLALSKPLHGYAIMDAVREVSKGRVEMGPGTLYGILKRLEKDQLIHLADSDGRRKTYQVAEKGKEALKIEYIRLSTMVSDGKIILGELKNK